MRIEGVSGGNMGMPMPQGADAMSRDLQSRIQKKQQELQELAGNQDMSMEEKMKRRQAIQQEITDLNMQLRQHQIELRREQQSKGTSADDLLGGNRRASSASEKGKSAGLSQEGMNALISADASMKQAKVQGGVASELKGRAGVLKAEIQQDGARGKDTQKKEEELADTEQRAADAIGAQMDSLNDADRVMKEAADAEKENRESGKDKAGKTGAGEEEGKTKKIDAGKEEDGVKKTGAGKAEDEVQKIGAGEEETGVKKTGAGEEEDAGNREMYIPVDVRV